MPDSSKLRVDQAVALDRLTRALGRTIQPAGNAGDTGVLRQTAVIEELTAYAADPESDLYRFVQRRKAKREAAEQAEKERQAAQAREAAEQRARDQAAEKQREIEARRRE